VLIGGEVSHVIGRCCIDEELEVLRRQLSQCESKLARLERNQKDEMDIDTDNKLDELQSLRDRLMCGTVLVIVASCAYL